MSTNADSFYRDWPSRMSHAKATAPDAAIPFLSDGARPFEMRPLPGHEDCQSPSDSERAAGAMRIRVPYNFSPVRSRSES